MKYSIAALLAVFTAGFSLRAQQSDSTGVSHTVNVASDHKPVIMQSEKQSDQPALIESERETPQQFKYNTVNRKVQTDYELLPIEPARMKGVPIDPLQRGYVKGGVGSQTTTLGEVYLNNTRSRNHQVGIKLNHLASKGGVFDKGFSGWSDNTASAFGKKYLKTHLIAGGLDYGRNVIHYYDYDPDATTFLTRDNTRQRFQRMGANARFMSFFKDSTMLNYDLNLKYQYMDDIASAREHNVRLDGTFDKYIGKEHFTMDAEVDYNNYNSIAGTTANSIIGLRPQVVSKGKRWRMNIGLGIFSEVSNIARFHFYPEAYFKYNVVADMLIPYVGVTGGLKRNSYSSITEENPFVRSYITLLNSNTQYEVYGGVRGAFSSTTSFNLRASTSRVGDMALFVNDEFSPGYGQFETLYDTVSVANLRAEISYQKSKKLNLTLRGDYWNYNPDNEFIAWQKPEFAVTFSGRYNLRDKIVAKADVYAISGQKARSFDPEDGEDLGYSTYAKPLKGLVDVNIGLEYRYNKHFSAWIACNNIGAFRYYRWNGYPTQRFTALGGITLSFWDGK